MNGQEKLEVRHSKRLEIRVQSADMEDELVVLDASL